ncbi:hypothetical protein OVA07_14140 [Novosphingobium sp. SL115]|nr:hypothetical protein [Novosphingobium sp. SL115]MCY1672144.1 hypothetical protein [Novosphingobium sp. SL115]
MPSDLHPMECHCRECTPPFRAERGTGRTALFVALLAVTGCAAILSLAF